MNQKNIEMIQDSKLWKKMKNNKYFRSSHQFKTRNSHYGYPCLWVFFDCHTTDKTLNNYLKEGYRMCGSKGAKGGCEYLDKNDIIEVYGLKVIVFS